MAQTTFPNAPVLASQLQLWPLDHLIPYERNSRSHPDSQIAQIAASIGKFGCTNPIAINPGGRIIAGYGRYLAARKRGLKQVPVIVLEHLSETQQRAYRIADNQLALNALWDEEALGQELQALIEEAFELNLLGFTEQELKRLSACPVLQVGRTDEDAAPELAQVAVSRRADLWQLDHHRVLCGDATSDTSMEQLMAGAQAAMAFTDPPYNVAY